MLSIMATLTKCFVVIGIYVLVIAIAMMNQQKTLTTASLTAFFQVASIDQRCNTTFPVPSLISAAFMCGHSRDVAISTKTRAGFSSALLTRQNPKPLPALFATKRYTLLFVPSFLAFNEWCSPFVMLRYTFATTTRSYRYTSTRAIFASTFKFSARSVENRLADRAMDISSESGSWHRPMTAATLTGLGV
jgi:hypothetical protein